MKRISLLFILAFSVSSSFGQGSGSSVLQYAPIEIPSHVLRKVTNPPHQEMHNEHVAMKTTTGTPHADWFDYWNQNFVSGTSNLYSFVTYPDSNLYDNTTGSSPYYVYCHGMGMSFDPTDDYYYSAATTSPITDPPITMNQGYTIDSFRFPYEYVKNYASGSGTDSVIIEFIVSAPPAASSTADSGSYLLKIGPSPSFLNITADSTPRFTSAIYTRTSSGLGVNECWDAIVAPKQRYAFPLIISGTGVIYTTMNMRLTTPLAVRAGQKVVTFIHFKSANSFSLGTNTSAANYMMLFAGSTAGVSTFPRQAPHNTSTGYPGSYQTGIIAQNQSRYGTGGGYMFAGHDILIPGVAFSAPILAVTQEAFHVQWSYFAPITGTTTICVGATSTLSDTAAGGTWSSGTPTVATINPSTGVVTALSVGTTIITYTTGSGSITTTVTVIDLAPAPVVTGANKVCKGSAITLTTTGTGGSWSSSNPTVATVNASSGIVTGMAGGVAIISYGITNSCGTASDTNSVFVHCTTGEPIVTPQVESISVYPNPNGGEFALAIASPLDEQAIVTITNITGQVIKTFTTATNKTSDIQLAQPSGIYFISVSLTNKRFVEKITLMK